MSVEKSRMEKSGYPGQPVSVFGREILENEKCQYSNQLVFRLEVFFNVWHSTTPLFFVSLNSCFSLRLFQKNRRKNFSQKSTTWDHLGDCGFPKSLQSNEQKFFPLPQPWTTHLRCRKWRIDFAPTKSTSSRRAPAHWWKLTSKTPQHGNNHDDRLIPRHVVQFLQTNLVHSTLDYPPPSGPDVGE